MTDAIPLLVVVVLVGLASATLRQRTGVVQRDHHVFTVPELAAVGVQGRPALVIFTAPGCSTCGPTRTLVEDVAAEHDVPVVVLDATEHEELAAAHRVLRAPTTFLIHPDGRIAGRIAGLPRVPDLTTLLGTPAHQVETAA